MGQIGYYQQCINTAVMLAVAVPALLFAEYTFKTCSRDAPPVDLGRLARSEYLLSEEFLCSATMQHPVLTVNVVYFFNVNVLFWVISLLQGSTWVRRCWRDTSCLRTCDAAACDWLPCSSSTLTGPSSQS
jgi:hypothetical protein